MKTQIGAIVLAVVCVGLVIALVSTKKQASDEKHKDAEAILYHSNQWQKVSDSLQEQRQVNLLLTNDLDATRTQVATLTNKLADVSAILAKTEGSLKAAEDEVAKRDAKIADLESQKAALDQRAGDLSVALTNLTTQIEDTQKKLAASEGDKAFLEKELQRLMAEKAELERQFNDLRAMRAQVARLKEELDISRRLDWIRKGLFANADQKGAQQLMQHGQSATAEGTKGTHYDLNVEIGADGSVRVIEPLTNRPAATVPPPLK